MTILRIGLGIQIFASSISLRNDWQRLFETNSGLIDRRLTEAITSLNAPFVPRLSWFVEFGSFIGLTEHTVIAGVWWTLLVSALFLCVGIFCRTCAVIAWLLFVSITMSSNYLSYGTDNFTIIGLFYLILAPFPDRHALDRQLWNRTIKDQRLHGFFRRVLQLHLCAVYFFGGLTKCLGSGWWNGDSMWRSLTRPPLNILPLQIVLSARAILPIVGIVILVLETGYPFFIWAKKTRLLWLIGIICMHVAIGLTMGLYLFALIMITLNLAAFGPEYLFRARSSGASLSIGTSDSATLPS